VSSGVRNTLLHCWHSRTVCVPPSWNVQGLSSTVLNSSTLNIEGRCPFAASTSEAHLRNFELESPAVLEVSASSLPSWSKWLTRASSVSMSLLTTP
jgi:hypothetical protein